MSNRNRHHPIGTRAWLCHHIPRWEATIRANRLEECRSFLAMCGYLRPSESDRIKRAIEKDFKNGM